MDMFSGQGLSGLALLSNAETRSISAENPTGARGGGAREVPDPQSPSGQLGRGWKVRPCIRLEAGTTTTLADISGPGIIQHIWITTFPEAYTDTVIRFYWDDEETPSVEVPLGDFFCNGFGLRYNVNSMPVVVNPVGGFNCYWPMPFRTLESPSRTSIAGRSNSSSTRSPMLSLTFLISQPISMLSTASRPPYANCPSIRFWRECAARDTMLAHSWPGSSIAMAGGVRARSNSIWMAMASFQRSVAPAPRIMLVGPGASKTRPTQRRFWATHSFGKRLGKYPAMHSIAGISPIRFAFVKTYV